MKIVYSEDFQTGMVVGRDIEMPASSGLPLVRRNTVLTAIIIESLRRWEIPAIFVMEESDFSRRVPEDRSAGAPAARSSWLFVPKPKRIVTPELREEAISSLQAAFLTVSSTKDSLHESSAQILKQLDQVVEKLVKSLQRERGALVNISDLKSYDEYTFHHSLSVAVLSIAVAQRLGFGEKELRRVGMCAIMHDIGKTAIPIEVINKTARLNEEEYRLLKTHSLAGYKYLLDTVIRDEDILRGVLHHHEKLDGTGYPDGINGKEIPLWSRIIAIADVYDALTSDRPYRTPMQPSEAVEYIMGGVDKAFDYDVVKAFVQKLELYPVGGRVQLSNGEIAYIMNNENQMRPVVRLASTGKILDLCRDHRLLSVVITRAFSEEASPIH